MDNKKVLNREIEDFFSDLHPSSYKMSLLVSVGAWCEGIK